MSLSPRAVLLAVALALSGQEAAAQTRGFLGTFPGSLPGVSITPASPVSRTQRFGGACQDCDLSNRALPGVRIEHGDFSRALFVRAFLVRMDGAGSTFEDADFSLANMTSARLMDAHADRARFSGAVMTALDASRAQLAGADFANAELPDASFVQARLAGASFAGTKAMRANFLRADLRSATMTYARLDGADFTQADLRAATFSGATLTGANLAQALHLTAPQLRGACGDGATRLPAGLHILSCAKR